MVHNARLDIEPWRVKNLVNQWQNPSRIPQVAQVAYMMDYGTLGRMHNRLASRGAHARSQRTKNSARKQKCLACSLLKGQTFWHLARELDFRDRYHAINRHCFIGGFAIVTKSNIGIGSNWAECSLIVKLGGFVRKLKFDSFRTAIAFCENANRKKPRSATQNVTTWALSIGSR